MAEAATPVVEKAEAPNTPPADAPKPAKLSYDPASLPAPVNNHDVYVRAALIEQRAQRAAIEALVGAVKDLTAAFGAAQQTAKSK